MIIVYLLSPCRSQKTKEEVLQHLTSRITAKNSRRFYRVTAVEWQYFKFELQQYLRSSHMLFKKYVHIAIINKQPDSNNEYMLPETQSLESF